MTKLKGFSRMAAILLLLAGLLTAGSCSSKPAEPVELKRFPLDRLDGIISRTGVALDEQNRSEGKASLRLSAGQPTVFRLFEIEGLKLENSRLIFRAKVRCELEGEGEAYLELWVRLPGKGEYFSRPLHASISKKTEWISMETPFFFEKGQAPDLIKLNMAVKGAGTVWIDDIVLLQTGL